MSNTQAIAADGRGIDRSFNELLDEATGIIAKYVAGDDPSAFHYEHAAESLAKAKVDARGGEYDKWLDQVRKVLKSRATDTDTVYPLVQKDTSRKDKEGNVIQWTAPQGVALDIGSNSVAAELGRDWGLPLPQIHFCELKRTDSFYDEKTARYAAIAFDPALADPEDDEQPAPRIIVWNGVAETIQSDWNWACFTGVVRTFGSYAEMKAARRDLKRAIRTIHADAVPTDAERDPFAENDHLEADMYDDSGL